VRYQMPVEEDHMMEQEVEVEAAARRVDLVRGEAVVVRKVRLLVRSFEIVVYDEHRRLPPKRLPEQQLRFR
jgi:hypothetical protein